MRIVVTDNGIPLGSVFRLVAMGYAVGVGIVMLPVMTLGPLGILVFADGPKRLELILMPLIAIMIVAGQALLIGLIVIFGLAVFQQFRRIEVHRELTQQGA